MDNSIYAALNRQSGLMKEMRLVANNIANSATAGFRREGVVFSEYVAAVGQDAPSLSMASAHGRLIDLKQGGMTVTNGVFDFAIEGDGFFQVDSEAGRYLTRAGSFLTSPEGELMAPDGARLLDEGGAPIVLPPGAEQVSMASDGTLSINGEPVARVGVFAPADPKELRHHSGTRFSFAGEPETVENARLLQGALEDSNVEPIREVARMIEVQRAYEMGQNFLERENERIRSVISTLSR